MAKRFKTDATGTPTPRRMASSSAQSARSSARQARPSPQQAAQSSQQLSTLRSGQGARTVDRPIHSMPVLSPKNPAATTASRRLSGSNRPVVRSHQKSVRVSKGPLIGIIVAIVVVLAALVIILWSVLGNTEKPYEVEDANRVEQIAVGADVGVDYDGYTYTTVRADDGHYDFVRQARGGADSLVLFALSGTPVSVVLYNGAFVIPENLDGTWDAVAWVMGDGSVSTQLVGADGQPVAGQGSLTSASLDGSILSLAQSDGQTVTVDLAQ